MGDISRIPAAEVRPGVKDGTALLVCAYTDDSKFYSYRLEGAMPLSEFQEKASEYPKDMKIVFYCA